MQYRLGHNQDQMEVNIYITRFVQVRCLIIFFSMRYMAIKWLLLPNAIYYVHIVINIRRIIVEPSYFIISKFPLYIHRLPNG